MRTINELNLKLGIGSLREIDLIELLKVRKVGILLEIPVQVPFIRGTISIPVS